MTDLVQQIAYQGTPHLPDTPAVSVEGLCVAYSSLGRPFARVETAVNALDEIFFEVNAGEQIAIIGPNGAGKSTLLKVLAGIIKPDSGSVKMYGDAPDKHICISYVSQRSDIDWRFPVTVADVVMMGRTKQIGLFRRPGKRDREIVHACLRRVEADHLADKQIGELSGGQQQRVFIARALALDTNLLLLDEPLTGLDVPSQDAILNILQGLRPDGVTVMVATHDLNLAAERFDRVMLLNQQIIAFDTPDEVLTQQRLLAAYSGRLKQGTRT